MAKKIAGYIKLQVAAGKANPSPPVGPALGQRGLNIMEFCKRFNAMTQAEAPGTPIPVVICYYADKSFDVSVSQPPVSYFIKKASGVAKGSSTTGKAATVGSLTMEQVKEIAAKKFEDMNANDMQAACSMIIGSAKSMGIDVVGG